MRFFMTTGFNFRPARGLAIISLGCLLLSGCSWFDLGDSGPEPLPGERLAVLNLKAAISADPSIADQKVALPAPAVNADWPQAGGEPSHAMGHPALGDALREVWRAGIGSGSSRRRYLLASPVVAGGRVFAMDAEGLVSARSTANGATIWSTNVAPGGDEPALSSGGISVAGGRLYVAGGFGQVVALDAATGKEIWRQPQPAPMRAAPTVVGNRVFVVTVDNSLVALSADDGHRLWTHNGTTETAGILGGASPAATDQIIVTPYSSGEVFALRADTGRALWTDNLTTIRRVDAISALADIRGRPVIDRGVAFAISHSGKLAAIDLRSGNRIWDREIAGQSQPWVAGDYVYVMALDGTLVCLTRREGRVRWIHAFPTLTDPTDVHSDKIVWSGVVLAGDRLILANNQGEAVAVSPYTGDVLGTQPLPGPVFLAPIVAEGTLFALTDDGVLVALR